jgi:hypothetical protein
VEIDVTVLDQAEKKYTSYHLTVEGKLLLGRGPDSPIPFAGTQLSRDHFALRVSENTLYVEDLSSNGTALDSIRIPGFEMMIDSLGAQTAPVAQQAAKQAIPPPPAESMMEPIRRMWRGLGAVERWVIYSAIACIALAIAYTQSN